METGGESPTAAGRYFGKRAKSPHLRPLSQRARGLTGPPSPLIALPKGEGVSWPALTPDRSLKGRGDASRLHQRPLSRERTKRADTWQPPRLRRAVPRFVGVPLLSPLSSLPSLPSPRVPRFRHLRGRRSLVTGSASRQPAPPIRWRRRSPRAVAAAMRSWKSKQGTYEGHVALTPGPFPRWRARGVTKRPYPRLRLPASPSSPLPSVRSTAGRGSGWALARNCPARTARSSIRCQSRGCIVSTARLGACPQCEGFGNVIGIDMDLVVRDPAKSLGQGAIAPWNTPGVCSTN